ncbi:rubredoxin [Pseudomaricurvus alkylphenolicus]|jgi:rubredoxin|uniref:rubredoxin n=1 Tax=Pseudomaricurvus alkylphenolicus TaxID=1306991 RepID=UPI00141D7626|nr:rubredoxin [Pseudomaricurvus alkylphenolicus]NIB41396.1 rubredoxin [Pseudomaricurvus alkylphenolicus]
MKVLQCETCGFVYSEEAGLPEEGIEPGTPWDQVPEDWLCPDCGMGKSDFHMVEVEADGLIF